MSTRAGKDGNSTRAPHRDALISPRGAPSTAASIQEQGRDPPRLTVLLWTLGCAGGIAEVCRSRTASAAYEPLAVQSGTAVPPAFDQGEASCGSAGDALTLASHPVPSVTADPGMTVALTTAVPCGRGLRQCTRGCLPQSGWAIRPVGTAWLCGYLGPGSIGCRSWLLWLFPAPPIGWGGRSR